MSLSAAAFFGDAAKVSRGPLVKMARILSDFQANAGYFVDQRVIQALVDFMEYIYRAIIAKVAEFTIKGQTTGGGAFSRMAGATADFIKKNMLPDFAKKAETFKEQLDLFKEYNEALKIINKQAREGLDPRKIQKLFSEEEDIVEAVASALQKRADASWLAGDSARGAVNPTQDFRSALAARQGRLAVAKSEQNTKR